MIIRGYKCRAWRWSSDDYGNSKPMRWLKERVREAIERECEHKAQIDW